MAFLNNASEKIKVSNVNPKDYTSWIKGELVFNDLRFADIIRKLERHYNIKINNNYTELNTIRFTGSFDSESIEQVLNSFSNYREFKYEINNNQININSNNTHMTKTIF
jgi:ferric-dicitrate binding protein FerR (iron transport regulator)